MTLIKAKFPVKLITRHRLSISKTLNKIGLNTNLFNEIVRVSQDEKKSSFITGKSLFIDNEFPERLDVLQNCKIPVIDLDQIDFFKFQLDTIQKRSLYFSGVKNIFLITNSSIYV